MARTIVVWAVFMIFLQIMVSFQHEVLPQSDSYQQSAMLSGVPHTTALSQRQLVVSNNATATRTTPHRAIFLHVGKAGGETIKNVLEIGCKSRQNKKRRAACLEEIPSTRLSTTVVAYYHCWKQTPWSLPAPVADTYLINLRHPVDRVVSWYNYVDPAKCRPEERRQRHVPPQCLTLKQTETDPKGWTARFFRCFSTLSDWAVSSSATDTNDSSDSCRQMARNSLHDLAGTGLRPKQAPQAAHLLANLQHYAKRITNSNNNTIWVIRTAHMWNDMVRLDRQVLGGSGDFGKFRGTAVTHRANNTNEKRSSTLLPMETRRLFCCALRAELQTYQSPVARAANLDQSDKKEEWDTTMTQCGVKNWEELLKYCGKESAASTSTIIV